MWYEIPAHTAHLMVAVLRQLVDEAGCATSHLCASGAPVGGAIEVLERARFAANELAARIERGTEAAAAERRAHHLEYLRALDCSILVQALAAYQQTLTDPALYELPALIEILSAALALPTPVGLPDAAPQEA